MINIPNGTGDAVSRDSDCGDRVADLPLHRRRQHQGRSDSPFRRGRRGSAQPKGDREAASRPPTRRHMPRGTASARRADAQAAPDR